MSFFSAHMANGTVNEAKPCLNRSLSYVFDFFGVVQSLNMFVGAEFKVNFVGITDCILYQVFSDKLRKIAPNLTAERQLSVGESACA